MSMFPLRPFLQHWLLPPGPLSAAWALSLAQLCLWHEQRPSSLFFMEENRSWNPAVSSESRPRSAAHPSARAGVTEEERAGGEYSVFPAAFQKEEEGEVRFVYLQRT